MKLKGFSVHFRLDPIFMLMHKQIIWARKRDGSIGCAGVMMNCSNCNENEPRFYFFFFFWTKATLLLTDHSLRMSIAYLHKQACRSWRV